MTKKTKEKKVPFPVLGPSHNFPLTKSLTLNGLIPKPSTAYYFTALNVSFVLEGFDVVCV